MAMVGYSSRVMCYILLLTLIVGAFSTDPLRGNTPGNNLQEDVHTDELAQNGCTGESEVTCTGPSVTKIPSDLPSNISAITFRNTSVTTIPEWAFEIYPNLTSISFTENSLHNISACAFRGLPDLESLYLTDNTLSESSFGPEPFDGLSSLEYVVLTNNALSMFPLHLFEKAQSLQAIDVRDNQISDMGPEINFPNNIEYIDLSHNRLESLNASMFHQMPNVIQLWLHSNQISVIHNGSAFMDLPSLTSFNSLYIHENPLHCDCQASWIVEAVEAKLDWAMNWLTLRTPRCGSPKWMAMQKIPYLYHQDLTCAPPAITAITPTNSSHTINTPLTLQATMRQGQPFSMWMFPDGRTKTVNDLYTWDGRVTDEIEKTDHSVVTTLKIDKEFDMTGIVNFTLIASNVAGDSNLTFWVYPSEATTVPTTSETRTTETTTEPTTAPAGGAVGGPAVCTVLLLLTLISTTVITA